MTTEHPEGWNEVRGALQRGFRFKDFAEAMAFVPGADWSERAAGTSAPGTALALGRSVQIVGAEHFNTTVRPWSCSAVPVRDRTTGTIIGVVDLTGGADAVGPAALPLLEATVAAVEAELQLLVYFGCAANEAYVCHAESPAIQRLLSCGDHGGVIGQAEIVVGAKVEQPLALHLDPGRLWRTDHRLGLE